MDNKKAPRKRKKLFLVSLIIKIILFSLLFLFLSLVVSFFFFQKQNLISPLPLGKTASEPKTANLEELLAKNNIPFSSIELASDSSFLVRLREGEEISFSPKKSITQQISSLQLVLTRLTIEGKRFKRLDFRFDKPLIILGN